MTLEEKIPVEITVDEKGNGLVVIPEDGLHEFVPKKVLRQMGDYVEIVTLCCKDEEVLNNFRPGADYYSLRKVDDRVTAVTFYERIQKQTNPFHISN